MSTESARKAAEELWNLKYGLKDDWIEKATPIISAACRTVAPPPDNIRDAHLFLSHYVAHVGHDADCGCNICRAFRLLDSSGAAPAVSTPPNMEDVAKRMWETYYKPLGVYDSWEQVGKADKDIHLLTVERVLNSVRNLGVAVSTPRCPVTSSTFDLWWPDQEFQPPNSYKELSAIAVAFARHVAQFFHPAPSPPPENDWPACNVCGKSHHLLANCAAPSPQSEITKLRNTIKLMLGRIADTPWTEVKDSAVDAYISEFERVTAPQGESK